MSRFDAPGEPLAFNFLYTFARFEYALKQSGYATGSASRVDADWTRFGQDASVVDKAGLEPILKAAKYIREHPPQKQIFKDGKLSWALPARNEPSEVQNVLLNVRTVRNNLFHGGKFLEGPVAEPSRDELLLQNCIAVLRGLLELPAFKRVSEYFVDDKT